VKALLLDLDGTLTDPKLGITNCVRYALERMGKVAPPADELLWFIGPPLIHSFRALVGEGEAERAQALYRERFATLGMFENELYPGIVESVAAEAARGRRIYLATSKAHVYAKPILEHFGLTRYFTAIYGSELDGTRIDKPDLLAYIAAREGIVRGDAVMVGDRRFDVEGARAIGALSVWADWGYGEADERDAAGADAICAAPGDLASVLAAFDRDGHAGFDHDGHAGLDHDGRAALDESIR
jgi:phosphoglycolate phosphatase